MPAAETSGRTRPTVHRGQEPMYVPGQQVDIPGERPAKPGIDDRAVTLIGSRPPVGIARL